MIIVKHRINTVDELKAVPYNYGIEVDLRDKDETIVTHDAFVSGEKLVNYIKHFNHSLLIANVKCEGQEDKLIELFKESNIEQYFFLDMSLPFIVKYIQKGFTKMAIRHSIYEPMEYTMKFAGKVDWVWIDCFEGSLIDPKDLDTLKNNFKTCLVSPELHGLTLNDAINFKTKINLELVDAVCTKTPHIWQQ
jgi:hypothetical protein